MTGTPERLRRVRELFDAVMDQPAELRSAYLERETGRDTALRREVEALVTASEETDVRLQPPAHALTSLARGDPSALVGQRLGAYELVRLVGSGGMGDVFVAARADDQYRKQVAIKVVQRGFDAELSLARFRRERQILASLEHPNIATLLDGGVTADGYPFLVMEYVQGEPITTWCDARALPLGARLALFRQVCGAVRHAHRNLVVHRDLKPGNILVTADGAVKLLDFGIAKLLAPESGPEDPPLTRGGTQAFTPEYASPEQLRGGALTTASDVYSLGVVLFELLTGRRPHRIASRALTDIEHAVLTQPIPRPSAVATDEAARLRGEQSADRLRRRLRGDLDRIALMALRTEPEQRYASVEALDEDIGRYLSGWPVRAQHGWAGYRLRKFVLRHPGAVTASTLLLLALVGGVIATTVQSRRARAEQLTAERVSGFLREILSSVRPVTGGRDVPVSEVLDAAARRMETELGSEPGVRAELEAVVGQSYQSLGRYDAAEYHLARALALDQQMSGARSLAAAGGLEQLGGLYLARGELDRADTLFRRGLALQDARSRAPDTLTATLLDDLGSVAHARGSDTTAERLHRRALAIRLRLLPPTSDAIAYSLNNVAVSLGEQSRWAEAEPLHRRAAAIVSANHPGGHPLVAEALSSLATALDLQGKSAAAESTYQEVIAMRRRLLGADHPDYALTLLNYAGFSFDQGHYERAMALSRELLALRGKTLPESHPAVAASLQTLGRCLDKLGDHAGAERALEESLALRQRYLPPSSWLIANSEGVLGEHYALVGQYEHGEHLLLRADSVLQAAFGPDHQRTQANSRRLVTLYDAWGKPARAAAYRAKLKTP